MLYPKRCPIRGSYVRGEVPYQVGAFPQPLGHLPICLGSSLFYEELRFFNFLEPQFCGFFIWVRISGSRPFLPSRKTK